jgi:hypothetical protein
MIHILELLEKITQHISCHDISLLRGLVGSWLTPGGALGYKVMGRTHLYDRRRIINTINSNLMFNCSACKS